MITKALRERERGLIVSGVDDQDITNLAASLEAEKPVVHRRLSNSNVQVGGFDGHRRCAGQEAGEGRIAVPKHRDPAPG